MKQKILFYFALLFVFTNAQISDDAEELLDLNILGFFCDLFNATITELGYIVNNFTFSTASDEDITIYQFNADGSNVSVNLGTLEGVENLHITNNDDDIIFLIHGFMSEGTSDFIINASSAYHSIGISNTFSVNWTPLADKINYLASAVATKSVGTVVGKWIYNFLNKNASLIDRVHLVGHSLGAHVSGFIGKTVINESSSEAIIGRITGLDVAAPFFESLIYQPAENRLDSTDAKEVDAYHTNAGFLGFESAIAQQDFYVNGGGPIQPGCNNGINLIQSCACSHSFSEIVFTKTINSTKPYIAKECSDSNLDKIGLCSNNLSAEMGEHNNITSLSGTFYGNTDEDANPI